MRYTRKKRVYKSKSYLGGNMSDKCIFAQLLGGLGNQLFIYAAALTVKDKLKIPICLIDVKDNVNTNSHSKTNYRTELFKQGMPVSLSTVKDRVDKSEKLFKNIALPHNNFKDFNVNITSNKNVSLKHGYYQNYEGIYPGIALIKTEFKSIFESKYPDLKVKFEKKYEKSNETLSDVSAFMHIRRKDYDKNALPFTYYQTALDTIKDNKGIKYIYIVSDDIDWCKKQTWNMHGIQYEFIDNTDEIYLLYYMSLCIAGAIMSGSSFSVWGVLLGANSNNQATILYPSKWFTGDASKLKFPNWWKKINVD